MPKVIKIESREHLLSALTEASELEHTLMCLYLYAGFSLKTSSDDGLSPEELDATKRWHKDLMGIAVQEMTHLALVANITTAVGGSANFHRPEFPVRAGYFPSEFVVELAPFDTAALEHFIFLERPDGEAVSDDSESDQLKERKRTAVRDRLMAHLGDYETVGQLYEVIETGITTLAKTLGEDTLFCGSSNLQIGPDDVKLPGLAVTTGRSSALEAITTIVEQGEGARTKDGSHFDKFSKIQAEYQDLSTKNPRFSPGRPAVRNPVMRKPVVPEGKVWIRDGAAARVMDLGNAIYCLMLRLLVQTYAVESRKKESRQALLESAFSLMHGVALSGHYLSRLPSGATTGGTTAGLNFALDRYIGPCEPSIERQLVTERIDEIRQSIDDADTETAEDCLDKTYTQSIAKLLADTRTMLMLGL